MSSTDYDTEIIRDYGAEKLKTQNQARHGQKISIHNFYLFLKELLSAFFKYFDEQWFICQPSDSTMSEDAGLGSSPGLLRLGLWQSDALTTQLDLIHS
jgi:hypothetical protein